MSDATQPVAPTESSLKLGALLSYGLMLVACTNGFTGIVGVVIAYIKREDAHGTPYESHYRNIIFVFWTTVVLLVVGLSALAAGAIRFATLEDQSQHHFVHMHLPELIGGGIALWGGLIAFSVWYLYRIIKGMVRAIDGRAY